MHFSVDSFVDRLSGGYQLFLVFIITISLTHVIVNDSILYYHLTTPHHHCKLPEEWDEMKWLPKSSTTYLQKEIEKHSSFENNTRNRRETNKFSENSGLDEHDFSGWNVGTAEEIHLTNDLNSVVTVGSVLSIDVVESQLKPMDSRNKHNIATSKGIDYWNKIFPKQTLKAALGDRNEIRNKNSFETSASQYNEFSGGEKEDIFHSDNQDSPESVHSGHHESNIDKKTNKEKQYHSEYISAKYISDNYKLNRDFRYNSNEETTATVAEAIISDTWSGKEKLEPQGSMKMSETSKSEMEETRTLSNQNNNSFEGIHFVERTDTSSSDFQSLLRQMHQNSISANYSRDPLDDLRFSSCEMYVDSHNLKLGTKSCVYGYIFSLKDLEWSVPAEWGLVCSRTWLRHWVQVVPKMGKVLGGISGGLFADRFGRRKPLMLSIVMAGVCGIVLHLVQRLLLYTIVRTLQAFFLECVWTISWVLLCESLPPKWRTSGLTLGGLAYPLGLAIAMVTAHNLQHWRSSQLAVSLPLTASIFYIWMVPESVRWLIGKGDTDKALVESGKLARQNLHVLAPTTQDHVKHLAKESNDDNRRDFESLNSILYRRRLRRTTMVLMAIWFSQSSAHRLLHMYLLTSHPGGTVLGLMSVGWGSVPRMLSEVKSTTWKIRNCFLVATYFGAWLTHAILLRLNRRKILLIGSNLLISSLLCTAMILIKVFSIGTISTLSMTLSALNLCTIGFVSSCQLVLMRVTLEVFPTHTRAFGVGLMMAMASIGTLVPDLLHLLGEFTNWGISWIAISFLLLISAILSNLLPETSVSILPDVSEEAEVIGMHRKLFKRNVPNTNTSSLRVVDDDTTDISDVAERPVLIDEDLSRSFRYRKYSKFCSVQSTCSQCSLMSLVDVSRVNGNNSDTSDSRSIKRYPVPKFRRSLKKRISKEVRRKGARASVKYSSKENKEEIKKEITKPEPYYTAVKKQPKYSSKIIQEKIDSSINHQNGNGADQSSVSVASYEIQREEKPRNSLAKKRRSSRKRKKKIAVNDEVDEPFLNIPTHFNNSLDLNNVNDFLGHDQFLPQVYCSNEKDKSNLTARRKKSVVAKKIPACSSTNEILELSDRAKTKKPKLKVSNDIMLRVQKLKESSQNFQTDYIKEYHL